VPTINNYRAFGFLFFYNLSIYHLFARSKLGIVQVQVQALGFLDGNLEPYQEGLSSFSLVDFDLVGEELVLLD